MFTHTCTSCAKTQLIFDTQVTAVSASADLSDAVRLTFTCWCGASQAVVRDLAAA